MQMILDCRDLIWVRVRSRKGSMREILRPPEADQDVSNRQGRGGLATTVERRIKNE